MQLEAEARGEEEIRQGCNVIQATRIYLDGPSLTACSQQKSSALSKTLCFVPDGVVTAPQSSKVSQGTFTSFLKVDCMAQFPHGQAFADKYGLNLSG